MGELLYYEEKGGEAFNGDLVDIARGESIEREREREDPVWLLTSGGIIVEKGKGAV